MRINTALPLITLTCPQSSSMACSAEFQIFLHLQSGSASYSCKQAKCGAEKELPCIKKPSQKPWQCYCRIGSMNRPGEAGLECCRKRGTSSSSTFLPQAAARQAPTARPAVGAALSRQVACGRHPCNNPRHTFRA